MRSGRVAAITLVLAIGGGMLLAQRGGRRWFDEEDVPMPADAAEKTEFAFGRLRYPGAGRGYWGGGSWATDYPKADRQFLQGLRRLTRLHARSVEQVVDINSPEIYDWPWLYAVEVGYWSLNDEQAGRLRDYLLRGGFLMVDDFHGTGEWANFMDSMQRVFPERAVVEIDNKDQIFHVIYDLDERFQVPGVRYIRSGNTYERDGYEPRWRGIYDDKGRVMVAICHNMDLGDAWEWADEPRYPEKFASLAYRVAVDYIVYAMSH
ncbi:MAG: DUF4159 domain-containing protein [Bryobacteraceae bacterium]